MTQAAVLFGAGATKALGGPLTDEILPHVLGVGACVYCGKAREEFPQDRTEDHLEVDKFLRLAFNVPDVASERRIDDYPHLPLLMTLIDQSIAKNEPLIPGYGRGRLQRVRLSMLTVIYDSLIYQEKRKNAEMVRKVLHRDNPYRKTLSYIASDLSKECGGRPRSAYDYLKTGDLKLITTNYDTYIENTLFALQHAQGDASLRPVDYGCQPEHLVPTAYTDFDPAESRHFGSLYKLHGSIAWGYCSSCRALYDGMTDLATMVIQSLTGAPESQDADPSQAREFRHTGNNRGGFSCRRCGCDVGFFMVAPSIHKEYENVHISRVWDEAETALREAEHWYIVGYSLPADDFEIARLLMRGLRMGLQKNGENGRNDKRITVIQKKASPDTRSRYERLFGQKISYHNSGYPPRARAEKEAS